MNDIVYERKLRIRSDQVNMTRDIRTSELFRLLEQASIAHTEELGCTRDKTLDRGLLWVIARQELTIEEMPRYDDEIVIKSRPGNMMHVLFPRFYEVWKDGRCIIRGEALWMLISEESRGMIMPEDYDISIPGAPQTGEIDIPALRIPEEAGAPVSETPLKVRFSQIDLNGHVNNTRYFDMIDDALGGRSASMTPVHITANYLSEMRMDEEFTLEVYEDRDTLYFDGVSGKPMFRIAIEYAGRNQASGSVKK
jgi:medium-chain acyl-[acyl-carrier-protein] hydrolase